MPFFKSILYIITDDLISCNLFNVSLLIVLVLRHWVMLEIKWIEPHSVHCLLGCPCSNTKITINCITENNPLWFSVTLSNNPIHKSIKLCLQTSYVSYSISSLIYTEPDSSDSYNFASLSSLNVFIFILCSHVVCNIQYCQVIATCIFWPAS